MNLGELASRIDLIVQDRSLRPHFEGWINNAILEIASDYELPALKLLDPSPLPVTTSNWLWPLPDNFHKKLYRCATSDWRLIRVHDHIDDLTRRNKAHDEIGEYVAAVAPAMNGVKQVLGIYPLATDILQLWYYRKPVVLVKPGDVCDCIPPEYHERVIIPRVVVTNYQLIQDQVENFDPKGLQYWEEKLKEGISGSPHSSIGLINYFLKLQGGPKRHGGRDPIGWRPYRYGG